MKTLNYLKTCFFVLLIFSMISTQAQTVVDTYGRLQVTGNKVTAEDGTPISLAGMSLFWSFDEWENSDFYKPEVVDYMVENWKISIIRVAIGVDREYDNNNGYADGPQGRTFNLNKIEPVIQAAINNGIYVILDWHTHKAEVAKEKTAAKEFFNYISDKYGNNKNILYEIYNEPINQTWSQVKNYAEEIIPFIRQNDQNNLIIVGSPTWSQDVDKAAANPITGDANLAYTLHFYAGTHKQSLRDKAKAAMDSGIALFVTEWGSTEASGNGGRDEAETARWIEFLRNNKISHVNWSINDKNETSSIIPWVRQPGGGNNQSDGKGVERLLANVSDDTKLTDTGNFIKAIMLAQAVDTSLSVGDFQDGTSFSVYPSPFDNYITIDAKSPIDAITVYDMTGRVILSKTINKLNPNISLGSLIPGNYILSIASNGSNASTIITRSK